MQTFLPFDDFECCEVWVEQGFGDTCAATIGAELAGHGVRAVRT